MFVTQIDTGEFHQLESDIRFFRHNRIPMKWFSLSLSKTKRASPNRLEIKIRSVRILSFLKQQVNSITHLKIFFGEVGFFTIKSHRLSSISHLKMTVGGFETTDGF